ncbi:MAG: hypothetical protein CSA18_03610 [Deltaproteobacteria bacterium]|nr:MAG: hypothetical protein CSA18_03610 [Deltaproteobacteria bacterium]
MKINISIDITPEELRESLGLPDFSDFNENIIKKMSESFEKGIIEPDSFFKAMNPASNLFGQIFMKSIMKNINIKKDNPFTQHTEKPDKDKSNND